ncbi:tafazzin [Xylaria bambusicola]|uniref:tafazzin n=1 Tax=Xylaria bambusicola TaxID=326684 RepID=UPI002007E3B3|nr:tafazzin [Xylaria bambusicola]KAI0523668.1 tafazzin [Xylaria bambusicola]
MPKKRRQTKYSKPPSVAPPALRLSSPSHSTSEHHDRSVNELLANLRRSTLNSHPTAAVSSSGFSAVTTPSVPPALRQLFQLPEAPTPAPRRPQRRDPSGRRPPPGPPPPRSWVTLSQAQHAPPSSSPRDDGTHGHNRYWPMPGAYAPAEGSLVDMVLKRIALDWAQQRDWNRFYLYTLPSRLRSALLAHVSDMYSPGLSIADLQLVLLGPSEGELSEYGLEPPDVNSINSDFFCLDLTGSFGRSLSMKELHELLFGSRKTTVPAEDVVQDSWDLPAPSAGPVDLLPNLTHLSLAIDPSSTPSVSWKQLLSVAGKLTRLTELSLAYWPEPSLTPNAKLAKVTSPTTGHSVQYGGTGPYSHSLDGDWTEAILVLKRLSRLLYSLEYLDLTGCNDWVRALREKSDGEFRVDFVDWVGDWGKISALRLNSGYAITADDAPKSEVLRFSEWIEEATAVEKHIRAQRAGRGRFITVERDALSETAQAIVDSEMVINSLH